MVPLKLQLNNFLSYGPELQTIDFEPYSLICFSGKNGHGKSALLDAITWALWGQARKISGTIKSDDALLRIGQTQMMVVLDFLCGGHTYRIRREYMKTYGKPYAALDFGLLDREKDTFVPMSDKTIRTTQTKIEQILHLNFDSFINSAFLRQGQANEFSKKSPKERKEILGTILGLGSYEAIRKLATEKVRQAQTEKSSLITYQGKINQELQNTQDVPSQITEIEKQLSNIVQEEQQINRKKQEIEANRNKLLKKKQTCQLLSFQLEQLNKDEKKQQEALHALRMEWKTVHTKQLHLPDHRNLEAKKKELVESINTHQRQLQKRLELKEKYLACQEQLQRITQELQKEQQLTLQQETLHIERLIIKKQNQKKLLEQLCKTQQEQKDEQKTIDQALKEYEAEINKLEKRPEKANIINQFEKRKEHYQKFIAQGSLIQKELNNLEQKQHLAQDDSNPSCPLCEQNLSASRRRFLKQKFIKEEQFLKHRLNRLTTLAKNLKELLIEQHKKIKGLTKAEEQQQLFQIKREELKKKNNELTNNLHSTQEKLTSEQASFTQVQEDLNKSKNNLEESKKQGTANLENNQSYQTKKQELANLESMIKNISYQSDKYKQAREQLAKIEEQLTTYQYDLEQIAFQNNRKQTIHELCCILKQFKQEKGSLKEKLKPFFYLENREKELNAQEQSLSTDINDLHKHKEVILQEKGSLEQQEHKRRQLEQEIKQYKQKMDALVETIEDYQAIAAATGKDGIQALLIQDIIPEIEQEANTLLTKLTDNQAQIFIESLRDLKKGGTKETLDIKISDEVGIRPYELFSGGEAFRIDFALRIAISKLLARRAGTSLQTLIIDEGFGSQDEEGLAHIMDAIYKIQDDFAKVIIVSHLTSMKDLFPVHFLIEKNSNGSFISVLEQG